MLYQTSFTDIEDPLTLKLNLILAEPSIIIINSKYRDLLFFLLFSYLVYSNVRRLVYRIGIRFLSRIVAKSFATLVRSDSYLNLSPNAT